VGKINPALFKDGTVGNYPRASTAALGALPAIFTEAGSTVFLLQAEADTVLQGQ